jgi:hypothetical protein
MSKGAQIVYFQFEGHPEIIQSHNWRLEMDVNLHRNRLGLPFWTKYKTISDYEPDPHPEQDLTSATLSSHVCDSDQPALVPKSAKKGKARKKTPELPTVSDILDNFLRTGTLPESHPAGASYTIPPSVDSRPDVQENE